ncbi:MAG: di-trans,poly-cis-decaprenylcistransferase [Clostridia bacterium]|nr:di-trans,poly-cis-decaprenylcistransferase [Clostridia bacterium]
MLNIDKIKNDPRKPKHLALIIDGNGRWAKERGLSRSMGHKFGFDNLKKHIEFIQELGINTLSIYCFSKENWNRPKEEVDYLMNLFNEMLDEYKQEYLDKDVRINICGDMEDDRLPLQVREKAKKIMSDTKHKTGFILNPCINYGGRQEIVDAVKSLVINREDITADNLEKYLYTLDLPAVDFIIRTSGEYRTSNFLPWQSVYSEWYFPKKYWPAFTKKDLLKALKIYMGRNRRFGAIKG